MSEERLLRFVRHGATSANSAGLRCGGDLDLPLTDLGREQAERIADAVARLDPPIGLIVTSDLRRTRDTALAIARRLPGVPIAIKPGFAERHLGRWNLLPIAYSQPWFDSRQTPPGGESDDEFTARVRSAIEELEAELPRRPLLVASKGVARVLGEMVGLDGRLDLENGEVCEFNLTARTHVALRSAA